MNKKQEAIAEQLEGLRQVIPQGSTVYGIVDHVAKSGMSAVIRLVIMVDGQPLWPNYGAALVTGARLVSRNGRDGLMVRGCGFNRLQHVVDGLSRALYGREGLLRGQDL